jgi:hypothetical protein
MAKSLRDITEELGKDQKSTADSLEKLNSLFKTYFQKLDRQSGDQEEDRREAKIQAAKSRSSSKSAPGSMIGSINNNLGLMPIGGILGALMPLTAGVTAFVGALAGLRGWEVSAIKSLGSIKDLVPNNITNAIIRLRNSAYSMFGLTPEGLLIRGEGRTGFYKAAPVTEQIFGKMKSLRIDFLRVFGLGVDGKPIALRDPDGLFKKNIIGRVTFQIGRLLKPLMRVADGVASFATGAGKGLFEFISKFITPLGGVAKLAGKILWPIGFIMSAFKGMEAYRESDADGFIAKLGDGIGGFLGDFIGAPFNLLKSGINWVFDKIFGVKRDENGNVIGDGWAAWASDNMTKFDFAKAISSVVSGIFGMVQGAVDWVGTLFTDPKAALSKLWTGLLDGIKVGGKVAAGLLDILWYPVNSLVDWATKKFEWRDEDAPKFNLRETITGWVTDFWTWFTGWLPDIEKIASDLTAKISDLLPDWMKSSLGLSGPEMDKEIANKIALDEAIKTIRSYDANNDGTLDKQDGISTVFYPRALQKAMNTVTNLRGDEIALPGVDDIRYGKDQLDISGLANMIDASTNVSNFAAKNTFVSQQAPVSIDEVEAYLGKID